MLKYQCCTGWYGLLSFSSIHLRQRDSFTLIIINTVKFDGCLYSFSYNSCELFNGTHL